MNSDSPFMKEMLDWIDMNIHFPITDPTWIFFLVHPVRTHCVGTSAHTAYHRHDSGRCGDW